MQPVISLIITVFNKAAYLPDTLQSLFWQQSTLPLEYIFVDDLSSDNSLEIIEQTTRGMNNVTIIRNMENRGPSVRLNQGAAAARGHYLQFFDSDDIMPLGTTAFLHRLLTTHHADLIYGRWERRQEKGDALITQHTSVNSHAKLYISDDPLGTILQNSFTRMTLMVHADTFARSGGADERIFIQDESLPLRLAVAAKRLITVETPVLLVPLQGDTLSANKSQLNHDRFLANALMLRDGVTQQPFARSRLFGRCVSAAWKQVRQDRRRRAIASWVFWYYLYTRFTIRPFIHASILQRLEAYMTGLPKVRRVSTPV